MDKNEVLTLLNDIYTYQQHPQEEPMYYLGSIILHEHDNLYSIIDGQQRITTLAILLHALSSQQEIFIEYHSPVSMENIQKMLRLSENSALKKTSMNILCNIST